LVKPLIVHSLDYIIADKLKEVDPEKALLSITVCDVACGSGHILLSAARRIGFELARVRSKEDQPTPSALRLAVRDVIKNCIYGVDLNPLAVELCKVALWLDLFQKNAIHPNQAPRLRRKGVEIRRHRYRFFESVRKIPARGKTQCDQYDSRQLQNDPQTDAIVMIGEIGGNAEELAATYIREHVTKPVVAFIAGRSAPPGKQMGHAGAIISGSSGSATEKISALEAAGIRVAGEPSEIPDLLKGSF
jgi:hypothetical protein